MAIKKKQLRELQAELDTRPPSEVVVQENIRRIKEQNVQNKLHSNKVTYFGTYFLLIELHSCTLKLAQSLAKNAQLCG